MNFRDPEACRDPSRPCVLDAPTLEQWQASGRGGGDAQLSLQRFLEANATFDAGLAFRAIDSDHCEHGHTDVAHALKESVGLCRERYYGDSCVNPAPAPFVCACVSISTAFAAQDELGEEQRFYFVMIGLGCCSAAVFMLGARSLTALKDWRRHQLARRRGLRYHMQRLREEQAGIAASSKDLAVSSLEGGGEGDGGGEKLTSSTTTSSTTLGSSLSSSVSVSVTTPLSSEEESLRASLKGMSEDVVGLIQCMCCCSFVLAFAVGPMLLWLAVPREVGYWVGCGFRIPAPVAVRPEFGIAGAIPNYVPAGYVLSA